MRRHGRLWLTAFLLAGALTGLVMLSANTSPSTSATSATSAVALGGERAAALRAQDPCGATRAPRAVTNTSVVPLCDDVYVEAMAITREEENVLRDAYRTAWRTVTETFGTLRAAPVVVFCRSAACKQAFGAPAEVAASNDLGFASAAVAFDDGSRASSAVVVSGPFDATPRVLVHELVHAEMKAWVPYDRLPTWFNEGTATFIANEPPCGANATDATDTDAVGVGNEGTIAGIDVTRLKTKREWQAHLRESKRSRETYCASRAEVARWLSAFDDGLARGEALRSLMLAIAGGRSFDDALRMSR